MLRVEDAGGECGRVVGREYRHGDLESPPIEDSSIDLAFFSQSLHHAIHPQKAVGSAFEIMKPGGRIVILDLKKHAFEEAREVYADTWLGFSEVEVRGFLEQEGFEGVRSWIVDREKQAPGFETMLAMGRKSSVISHQLSVEPGVRN